MFHDTDFLFSDEIILKLTKTVETNPDKDWLPAYHFDICLPDGTKAGICDLRVGYNQKIYYGGNIGYTVYPEHRGHRYAAKACLLLFELAKKHGLHSLIITCNPDNQASRKTCEYAGGMLEAIADLPVDNDMYRDGERQKCIYRFKL